MVDWLSESTDKIKISPQTSVRLKFAVKCFPYKVIRSKLSDQSYQVKVIPSNNLVTLSSLSGPSYLQVFHGFSQVRRISIIFAWNAPLFIRFCKMGKIRNDVLISKTLNISESFDTISNCNNLLKMYSLGLHRETNYNFVFIR